MGVPQKILSLYGIKSSNFRQNKHGNALPVVVCLTVWEKGRPFELGSDYDLLNIY